MFETFPLPLSEQETASLHHRAGLSAHWMSFVRIKCPAPALGLGWPSSFSPAAMAFQLSGRVALNRTLSRASPWLPMRFRVRWPMPRWLACRHTMVFIAISFGGLLCGFRQRDSLPSRQPSAIASFGWGHCRGDGGRRCGQLVGNCRPRRVMVAGLSVLASAIEAQRAGQLHQRYDSRWFKGEQHWQRDDAVTKAFGVKGGGDRSLSTLDPRRPTRRNQYRRSRMGLAALALLLAGERFFPRAPIASSSSLPGRCGGFLDSVRNVASPRSGLCRRDCPTQVTFLAAA